MMCTGLAALTGTAVTHATTRSWLFELAQSKLARCKLANPENSILQFYSQTAMRGGWATHRRAEALAPGENSDHDSEA